MVSQKPSVSSLFSLQMEIMSSDMSSDLVSSLGACLSMGVLLICQAKLQHLNHLGQCYWVCIQHVFSTVCFRLDGLKNKEWLYICSPWTIGCLRTKSNIDLGVSLIWVAVYLASEPPARIGSGDLIDVKRPITVCLYCVTFKDMMKPDLTSLIKLFLKRKWC